MIPHWLHAKSRRTLEMCRQLRRLVNEQRDMLPVESVATLEQVREETISLVRTRPTPEVLKSQAEKLESVANELLIPYPSAGIRENIKEMLVALVTIFAFSTFFLQLTKIPTGSMQPTLFGITHENLLHEEEPLPGFLDRRRLYWFYGISYKHLKAPFDGEITKISKPRILFPFIKRQTITFQGEGKSKDLHIWFPPETLSNEPARIGLYTGSTYNEGQDILKLKVVAGDHLLVDRMTYNFRRPHRGEIIVFKTEGIKEIYEQDLLYIKRLVALPGEEVQISNDNHLIINGRKLTASERHFEYLYTPSPPGTRHPYLGHVNEFSARRTFGFGGLADYFQNENDIFQVPPKHYLAFGDNTLHSRDSRAWGSVPQENIIGRCWFVYWPLTDRFGWGYR
ncbi:MAG: signal peptidase I [Verrucomicrobiales bacterium]